MCCGMRKGAFRWNFMYLSTLQLITQQLFHSKFDIYIVFVPFCMHAPFSWHSINDE